MCAKLVWQLIVWMQGTARIGCWVNHTQTALRKCRKKNLSFRPPTLMQTGKLHGLHNLRMNGCVFRCVCGLVRAHTLIALLHDSYVRVCYTIRTTLKKHSWTDSPHTVAWNYTKHPAGKMLNTLSFQLISKRQCSLERLKYRLWCRHRISPTTSMTDRWRTIHSVKPHTANKQAPIHTHTHTHTRVHQKVDK